MLRQKKNCPHKPKLSQLLKSVYKMTFFFKMEKLKEKY